MRARLPLLIRVFAPFEGLLKTAARLHAILQAEVLWAWTPGLEREAVTEIIYGRAKGYLPGGCVFEEGLFAWEQVAIRQPPFPQAGRILLGGAGGGRELAQLCRLGYEVVAFEPSEPLLEGARQAVSRYPGSAVVRASYADFVTAVEHQSGPLAPYILSTAFDAVILGDGSFGYVVGEADRRRLLRAIRALAPAAPVLFSFFLNDDPESGWLDRLRPLIQGLFRLLGSPSARQRGDVFYAGFAHCLTPDELRAAAADSGYRVVFLRTSRPPHAMLTPR
ncbi:MAG: hypothetical protein ABSC23_02340 [Bryobacteraceae bacterium]|jgi:hypothetical protein